MNKVEKSILMVLSTVLLTLSFTSCSKEENDNNKPSEKRLEKITVKEYEWKFGEKSTYGELYEEFTYDENGNLVKFGGFCIIPWIKMLNYTSISTKLS